MKKLIFIILVILTITSICQAEYLKKSTATAILIGPFLDDTDGKTAETALTVTNMDADIYKHSDSHPLTKSDLIITASGGDNDCAHVANGYYSLELTDANTDTEGRFIVTINITGALPVWHEYSILDADSYDALIGGTLPAAAVIADAVWDEAVTDHTTGTTFGGKNQHLPADVWSVATRALTDKAGFTISGTTTTLDALSTHGDSTWATSTGFSTHSAADVWSAATRALTDKAGFTISGTTTTLDALSTHGDSTWATSTGFSTHSAADVWSAATRALTDKAGFTISGTTTTLDALSTHGDSTWATSTGFSTHSAADVWSAATRALTDKAGFTISGTTTTLDALSTHGDSTWATSTGFSTHSAADVWSAATRALTDKAGFTISGTTTTLDALSTHGDSTWATSTGFSTHSAADVWSAATRKLTELDEDNTTIDLDGSTIGTVTTLTGHTAQTGDSYAVVTNVTYGLSVLEALVDDIESRLTAARAGYLDKLNVAGTLAHSDANDIYKAAGFSTHSAADVWAVGTRALTDKAGFSLAADQSAVTIGTVSTLTGHTAQTGDSYAVVTNGTYGLSVLEALVDDIESRLTAARAGYLDKLNVAGTLAHSDANDTYKAAGFSTHNAAAVVTALMADTGITAGGTYTFEDYIKSMGAYMLGTWQDKTGDPTTQEILDWEDDSTVILEMQASSSTPYKQTTKK